MGSDIRAGAAFVELYVKGNIKKDLDDISRKLKSFGDGLTNIGKKMLGIGAAILGPLGLAVHQFDEMGDAVNKASQRTGIAVETLSALKYAAEQSGASFEDLESAIRKMEKAIFEAEGGSKGAMEALAGLGLSVQQVKGLQPDKAFLLISDRLSKVSDAGAKASIAMELFGKGGAKMLPLIQDGAAGIKELTDRAKELGLIIGKDDAEAATKFGDTLSDLYSQMKQVVFVIGAAVAQVLQPFATAAIRIMTGVIQWVSANRNLVVSVLGIGLALVAAGAAFVALGIAIKFIVGVGAAVAAIFSAISGAIAFLLNPIVLVAAAIIGLAAYFAYATGVMGQAVDWLSAKFSELGKTFGTMIGGIVDALAAGDIQLAAQILWVGLKLAWAQGTSELREAWIKFKYTFVEVAVAAFYGALEIWAEVKAALISSWLNFVAILGDAWDGFANIFAETWDNITSGVAKGILYIQSLWDDSFNYDEAVKQADKDLEANARERDKATGESVLRREAQLKKDLAAVDAERQKKIQDLENEAQNLVGGAEAAKNEEIDALNRKKADLQKQLADLRAQAAKERKEKEDKGPPLVNPKKFDLDDILAKRKAIESPAKSNGIFNVRGLQGLQSSATDEYLRRTAKASEETAKNTKNKAQFV